MAVYTYQRSIIPPRGRFLITDQAGSPCLYAVRDRPWLPHYQLQDTTGAIVAETRRRVPSFPPAVSVLMGGRVVVTVQPVFGLPPHYVLPEIGWRAEVHPLDREITIVDGSGLTQGHISRRRSGLKITTTVETAGGIPDAEFLAVAIVVNSRGRRRR